jgi:non-ribosomal peptide synthase protein (TIGR01720 family)
MLAGLMEGYRRWSGEKRMKVDVEGHGREEVVEGEDVSRTVGWFTSIYPVVMEGGEEGEGEKVKRVKEKVRRVPRKGIGYGVLRYKGREDEREKLREGVGAEISFLYLGKFDQATKEDGVFEITNENRGRGINPALSRPYLLEITGYVINRKLHINWTYSNEIHNRESIEALSQYFIESLRSIIDNRKSVEATANTTSDAIKFGWSKEDFDDIVNKIGQVTN